MTRTGNCHTPNGLVGQTSFGDIDFQAFENRNHIDRFAVRATVEVIVQLFGEPVSLLPRWFGGIAYRIGSTSARHRLGGHHPGKSA